jgi:hypothetical protein
MHTFTNFDFPASFDQNGHDRYGFSFKDYVNGMSPDGFDYYGFNSDGFDRYGFDIDGRDRAGFDRDGLNRAGLTRNEAAMYDQHFYATMWG